MNRSFHHARYVLGSAALLVLAGGCGGESRQAQTPSETFESRAPEGSASEQGGAHQAPGAADQHGMGHMMPGKGDPHDPHGMHGQPGLEGQPGAQGQPMTQPGQTALPGEGFGQTTPNAQANAAADMMSEQELCAQLLQGSNVRVENIDRGARIVITPKNRSDLATVRESVQRIEAKLQPTAQPAPRGEGATRCALFDVIETGARATIQEGPNQISLLLVATDNEDVAEVRRQVRAFTGSAGKARSSTGNGQQQQGTPKQQGNQNNTDKELPPDGDQRRLP